LDVGGYLGETAYLFKRSGAEEVVVYESFVECTTSHNSVGWIDVLRNEFEVAKVDCESCEKHLLSLPDDLIRKIPKWVIECHGPGTLRQLGEKFLVSGFKEAFKPYSSKAGYQLIGRDKVFNLKPKYPKLICLF
jgi:hypothetical protein